MGTRVKFVLFCCMFLLMSPLFAAATRQSRAFAAATQSAVKRETEAERLARRDIEADQFLARVNRPYVKSFTSPYGDIVDCVRIEDQLTLDDPLMKNHTIQMKPMWKPEEPMWKPEDKPGKVFEMMPRDNVIVHRPDDDGCTNGTIPIIRIRKEDVLNFDPIESYGRKHPSYALWFSLSRLPEIDKRGSTSQARVNHLP